MLEIKDTSKFISETNRDKSKENDYLDNYTNKKNKKYIIPGSKKTDFSKDYPISDLKKETDKATFTQEDLIKAYKAFEKREIKTFIKHYSYRGIKEILTNLSTKQVNKVKELTKNGIEEGVEDYLKANNQASVYTSDLADFFYDDTIETKINEKITNFNSALENIEMYSNKIRRDYATFIYNESFDRFNEQNK